VDGSAAGCFNYVGRAAKVNAALFSIPILDALKLRVQSFWNSRGGHRAGHRSLLHYSALRCRHRARRRKESSSVFSRPRPSRKRPRVETQGFSEHSGIKKGWFLELVPLSNERLHVEIVISQTIKYQSLSYKKKVGRFVATVRNHHAGQFPFF
jgi:hypothetical protein